MSTTLEAAINPLTAACEAGFRPDEIHVLNNSGIGDQFDDITSMMERVVVEYGGDEPVFSVTHLDRETDFSSIVDHFREPIARLQQYGGTAAVAVTPGRKFMSAIAFQAGIQFEADHGFYPYIVDTNILAWRLPAVLGHHVRFPVDIPRTVTVSWDELGETLYTLSVLFGVLQLPKVTLYGVWNGKSGKDWQRWRLDVDCRSEKIREKLQRDRPITTEYEAIR